MAALPAPVLAASLQACVYERLLPQLLADLKDATNAAEPDIAALLKLARQTQLMADDLSAALTTLVTEAETERCRREDAKTAEIVGSLRASGWLKSNVVPMRGAR